LELIKEKETNYVIRDENNFEGIIENNKLIYIKYNNDNYLNLSLNDNKFLIFIKPLPIQGILLPILEDGVDENVKFNIINVNIEESIGIKISNNLKFIILITNEGYKIISSYDFELNKVKGKHEVEKKRSKKRKRKSKSKRPSKKRKSKSESSRKSRRI
jgi:hypothetical protein